MTMMKDEPRAEYLTRDGILKLLSDDEVARVSTAETAEHLADGDEYLDLEQLRRGVRRAGDSSTPMGRVLPRKAVLDMTWSKILAHLSPAALGRESAARSAGASPAPHRADQGSVGKNGIREYAVAGVFVSHQLAEAAIKALQAGGIDMRKLSIVGKSFRSEEHAVGFYTSGDRMLFWGGQGAFWGSLWGMLFGGALFVVPGLGPLVAMGPVVGWIAGAIEGAVVGGAAGVIGAALTSLGIPEDEIVKYQTEIKAGKFLVLARGGAAEIDRAQAILRTSGAAQLTAQAV